MGVKKRIRRILGEEPQSRAERVLANCSREHVDCATYLSGALRVALFLQNHPESDESGEDVKVRIAYRTFHPRPVSFKKKLTCVGGTLGDHDADQEFELMAGRDDGQPRSAIVPGGVSVKRGVDGTQVDAHLSFGDPRPVRDDEEAHFAVAFPDDGALQCSCC